MRVEEVARSLQKDERLGNSLRASAARIHIDKTERCYKLFVIYGYKGRNYIAAFLHARETRTLQKSQMARKKMLGGHEEGRLMGGNHDGAVWRVGSGL